MKEISGGLFPECQSCTLDKHCVLTHNQVYGAMQAVSFCTGTIMLDGTRLRCRVCGIILDDACYCKKALSDDSSKVLSEPKPDYKSIIRPPMPTILRLAKEVVDNMGRRSF